MTPEQIDNILMVNAGKISPEAIDSLRLRLQETDQDTAMKAFANLKSTDIMLVISVLVGSLGVDRFLLDDVLLGVLKLFTAGGCGIWTIIDWFTVSDRTRQFNTQRLLAQLP